MSKRPYTIRELLKKLKSYGIVAMERKRGKGSELILIKPNNPDSTKGPQIPIKNHGPSSEIYYQTILAILRRFDIDPKDFWD
ncbi:MAG: type II toxin-antitoxin system HicA family toxin [Proteobacteria bacterium]|nr:type II toxin-antitoxin system HicA family toxin [Pseudomonadota bacterium]MBU4295062.1 type II toxin-antitoxin system HicA family toxin [Pseudomonadota bacterium]MCG2748053.1 type II toxin-antitoxin system HicA family toxin [Desulfobulbaceae bacterium]